MDSLEKLSIKDWSEADRPREKLFSKGKHILSEAELIAIIIGSGSKHESAVDLSKRILSSVNNDLNELSTLSIAELMKFKGMGEAKAIGIIAALELGRRRRERESLKKGKITSSKDIVEIFQPSLSDLKHEEFWVLFLNRANKIINKFNISIGGVSGTVVDAKIIFKLAVENLASSIILCHNHPSGNNKPSESDINITKQIKEAGKFLEIPILDHIIISGSTFYSFADEGML